MYTLQRFIAAIIFAAFNSAIFLAPLPTDARQAAQNAPLTAADLKAILQAAQSGFSGIAVIRNDNLAGTDDAVYQVEKPIGRFVGCTIRVKSQTPKNAVLLCTVLTAGKNRADAVNTYGGSGKIF